MTDRDEKRKAARDRHWRAETERFHLKPWETRPLDAGGDPPDPRDDTMGAKTWAKARALREMLLRENPAHYDDVDYDDDEPEEDE